MQPWERKHLTRAACAAAALACCALTWTHGANQGSVELFAEVDDGRLDRIEGEMKAYKTKLTSVLGEFHGLQARQSKLRGEEQSLDEKERDVKDIVHHTRNAITSLEYEVHNLRNEQLSDSMFGHHASAALEQVKAATSSKEGAKARLSAKAGAQHGGSATAAAAQQHKGEPVAAVRVVEAVPAAKAKAAVVVTKAVPVSMKAAPSALQVAATRAALQRAAVAREQLAVEQKRELRDEARDARGMQKNGLQQLANSEGEVYKAQVRANMAQKQAYMRSAEYMHTQDVARRTRERASGNGMPMLPILQPLGPEAAAP